MVTAIDSSVLLDVLLDDGRCAAASKAALRQASGEGSLILCEVVLAEITPVLGAANLEEFLHDWNLVFAPSSAQSAILAGDMFHIYLRRGGKARAGCSRFSYRGSRADPHQPFAHARLRVLSGLLQETSFVGSKRGEVNFQ